MNIQLCNDDAVQKLENSKKELLLFERHYNDEIEAICYLQEQLAQREKNVLALLLNINYLQ